MRDFWIVAKYTAKEMLKRKAFLISNFIILLLIVAAFNVPNILKLVNPDQKETSKQEMLLVDSQNLFEGTLEQLKQNDLNAGIQIENNQISEEMIKEKIEKQEIKEAMILSKVDGQIQAKYITESMGMGGEPTRLITQLNELYKNLQISKLGLSTAQLEQINIPITLSIMEIKEGSSGSMLFIAMMASLVFFYAIYFCAYQVSSSITTEKTSKIMETLVTVTKPKTIVLGKTIGIGLVGLLQIAVMVAVAFVSYQLFMPADVLNGIFDISKITPMFIGTMFIYFILGYALYSMLYALTGSTVSKPEDINSANSPVAILAVVGFYLAYFSMMNPTSQINTFASLFPFSAPFSMPFRIISGTATLGELGMSLGILVVSIIVIAFVAIRIYSSAILHHGSRLRLKDFIQMYKQK